MRRLHSPTKMPHAMGRQSGINSAALWVLGIIALLLVLRTAFSVLVRRRR